MEYKNCKTCGLCIPKEKARSWGNYQKKQYCSQRCKAKGAALKRTEKNLIKQHGHHEVRAKSYKDYLKEFKKTSLYQGI